jgi:hypothetical protein
MIRQLTAVLSVAMLGCGKTEVTAPQPAPAAPAWQTIEGSKEGTTYTLQLPPGWKWDPRGEATKTTLGLSTFGMQIRKAFSNEDSDAYAKKTFNGLQIQLKGQKGRIRDLRIIKVGDVSAVWSAISFDPGDKSPTTILKTQCFLRTAGRDVGLELSRTDVRPERKEADSVESQREFLKIAESFRVIDVKDAKQK